MPSEIVQRVLDQIHLLTAEEREEVKALMNAVPFLPDRRVPEDTRRVEVHPGIIITRRPPITDHAVYEDWKPVAVQGKPVSETIIEERR